MTLPVAGIQGAEGVCDSDGVADFAVPVGSGSWVDLTSAGTARSVSAAAGRSAGSAISWELPVR
jgi:hypothetical protein